MKEGDKVRGFRIRHKIKQEIKVCGWYSKIVVLRIKVCYCKERGVVGQKERKYIYVNKTIIKHNKEGIKSGM